MRSIFLNAIMLLFYLAVVLITCYMCVNYSYGWLALLLLIVIIGFDKKETKE